MILLIDNYDSFVFTLARYVVEAGQESEVVRNDAITGEQLLDQRPSGIILSPGPKGPYEAGNSMEIVQTCAPHIPILGVCLGHQAIAAVFGADIVHAPRPVHGQASPITHNGSPLFEDVPETFSAARYHSLVVAEPTVESPLLVTARDEAGLVMGVRHSQHPVFGIQFHPESILTPDGHRLVENFLTITSKTAESDA